MRSTCTMWYKGGQIPGTHTRLTKDLWKGSWESKLYTTTSILICIAKHANTLFFQEIICINTGDQELVIFTDRNRLIPQKQ